MTSVIRTRYYMIRSGMYWDLAHGWVPLRDRGHPNRCTIRDHAEIAEAAAAYHVGSRILAVIDRVEFAQGEAPAIATPEGTPGTASGAGAGSSSVGSPTWARGSAAATDAGRR